MSYFQKRNTRYASLAVVNLHSDKNSQDELQRPLLRACQQVQFCVSAACICQYISVGYRRHPLNSVLSQLKRPSRFLHVLFTETCFSDMWNVCCTTYIFFFFQCVFKHLFFTRVSYFQDSYSGGPSLLSGSWAAYRGCSSVWFTEVWASCLHCDLCLPYADSAKVTSLFTR